MKKNSSWFLLLAVVISLFFWKILFSREFSVFVTHDNANQTFSWNYFAAREIRQGRVPLWDPYVQGGHAFAGEMQTALFYPLKLPLYLWPSGPTLRLQHIAFVAAHVLGAWFLFLLCREFALSPFASFVGALCFSLGGFTGRVGWPNMLDSAIWSPLILLCIIRAAASAERRVYVLWAALGGLSLGMAILAGSLHVGLIDSVLVVAAGFFATGRNYRKGATIVAMVAVVAFFAGAVQLLPSMEYSPHAMRERGSTLSIWPATQKPPYTDLIDAFQPHSWQSFLFGSVGAGALAFSPYFGVMPLLLAIIGAWRYWPQRWIRFLTALSGIAFLFALGSYSLFHGLMYTLTPVLWMAPEAGRFIYLLHLAGAVLAGFGVDALLNPSRATSTGTWTWTDELMRVMKWVLIASAAALLVPTIVGHPQNDEWIHFSFLIFAASAVVLMLMARGHKGPGVLVAIVAIILTDLHGFNWTIHNIAEARKQGIDSYTELMDAKGVADFFKSKPGLFRIHFDGDFKPGLGDLYGVQTVDGKMATILRDFNGMYTAPQYPNLMNIRYFVVDAKDPRPGVYTDKNWKVLESPGACPRAWLVHEIAVEPSRDRVLDRLKDTAFEPKRIAILSEAPQSRIEPATNVDKEQVVFDVYEPGHIDLHVHAESRALLVMSEVNYPGWDVRVNDQPVPSYRADAVLRAVVAPAGDSRITMRYRPWSVVIGAILAVLCFGGVLTAWAIYRRALLR